MHHDGPNGGWRRTRAAAPIVLVAFGFGLSGVLLGRATVPGTPGREATSAPATAGGASDAQGPCPAPDSAAGAARAAACLTGFLYGLEGRPAEDVRDRLRAAATGDAATARLAALVAQGVPNGGRAAVGVVSVRVDTFTPASAQVFVWTAVARSVKPGSPDSDAVVDAGWFTEALALEWSNGRWTLADLNRTPTTPPAGSPNLGPQWTEPSYVD